MKKIFPLFLITYIIFFLTSLFNIYIGFSLLLFLSLFIIYKNNLKINYFSNPIFSFLSTLLAFLLYFSFYYVIFKPSNPLSNFKINYLLIMFFIIQASIEELFFRSTLYALLKEKLNVFSISLFSAIIFSLAHIYYLDILVIIFSFIVGFILMYISAAKENFYYAYFFHILNNVIISIFSDLKKIQVVEYSLSRSFILLLPFIFLFTTLSLIKIKDAFKNK